MFLSSNKLEQLEFKLEKIVGIWKHAGKVRKLHFSKIVNDLKVNWMGQMNVISEYLTSSQLKEVSGKMCYILVYTMG